MIYDTLKARILPMAAIAGAAFALFNASASYEDAIADGKSEFDRMCASCHGTDGKGNGRLAESLTPPPPDLRQIAKRQGAFSIMKITEVIDGRAGMRGHVSGQMPVWGERYREDVNGPAARARILNLVLYLESIQAK